jgi:hypothetical protein
MTGIAKVLRYTAFTSMALFGLLGGMFVAGYAFEDLGGWAAVGLTALWLVPLVALSAFALVRPEPAAPVLVGVTGAVALFSLADSAFGIVPRDAWGPVAAIAVFAAAVALAFLGLHRARLAGLLMVVLAVVQLAATMLGVAVHGAGEGPGPGALLGGSSGVVVVPVLVVGALFLLAGSLDHEPLRPSAPPRVRPAG